MNGIGFLPRLPDAGRCLVAMCAVRPLLVVELPPALDQHLRFGATSEPFAIEQLVAQFAGEAFDETVLPRASRPDEGRPQDRGRHCT